MGGLLDDAAGGPRDTVLCLRQVGQGHGGVDLPPVRLVFTLHLLRRSSNATTGAAADRQGGENKTENNERRVRVQARRVTVARSDLGKRAYDSLVTFT